jgi:hypothetical protein
MEARGHEVEREDGKDGEEPPQRLPPQPLGRLCRRWTPCRSSKP